MIALPRSTFYYQSVLQTEIGNDKQALELIEAVQDEFPGYGYQRITHTLRTQGDVINHKRIARIMKEHRLSVRRRRRRPYFTSTEDGLAAFPNLYCNLIPSQPNKVWIADITFIRITTGFAYLAVILDAWSRKVIGYAISRPLESAQYCSYEYWALLRQFKMQPSMSRTGNCYDNAPMESFWGSLKNELVHHRRYLTREHARNDIAEYIELFYNRQRRHSRIGYLPPASFTQRVYQQLYVA